jgi:hypothetical protein
MDAWRIPTCITHRHVSSGVHIRLYQSIADSGRTSQTVHASAANFITHPLETRVQKLYNFEVVMVLVHRNGAKGCQLPVNENLEKIEALRSSLYRLINEVDGDLLHPSVVDASTRLDHAITEWQKMQTVINPAKRVAAV